MSDTTSMGGDDTVCAERAKGYCERLSETSSADEAGCEFLE